MTLLLNLVVIRAVNLQQSLQFYGWLGLEFAPHRHGTGPEHYACQLGTLTFELYPRSDAAQSTSATRIGFRVNGLDALLEILQKHSVPIISPPKESPWGRRAVVADPDGHRVELVEAVPME